MTPSSTISGMEPRRVATTGVPHIIASTTERPNGSSKAMRCRSAPAPARNRPRSAPPSAPSHRTRSPSIHGSTSAR